MELSERFGWLLLGMAIGFVLGFIVAQLRAIEQKVDTVDEHISEVRRSDEKGFLRIPIVADALYLMALLVVLWGVFLAQKASNQVEDAQKHVSAITDCNKQYLSDTIEALNQRTTYTREQARLNAELQKAQADFVTILLKDPPPTSDFVEESLERYYISLSNFVSVASKTEAKAKENPYPTPEEFQGCLDKTED